MNEKALTEYQLLCQLKTDFNALRIVNEAEKAKLELIGRLLLLLEKHIEERMK